MNRSNDRVDLEGREFENDFVQQPRALAFASQF